MVRFSRGSSGVAVVYGLLHSTHVVLRSVAKGDAAGNTEGVRSNIAFGIHTSVQNIEELYSAQRRDDHGFVHGRGQLSVVVR